MDRELDFEEAAALLPVAPKALPKAPWHLILVGGAALLWSLLGVFDLLATVMRYPPYMNQMPDAVQAFIYALPPWVLALRAIAVFSGLAGAALLLRRRLAAVRMLALSATTTILSIGLSFLQPLPPDTAMPVSAVFIVVSAVLLLYYAMTLAKKGVLRAEPRSPDLPRTA